jgi:hypothetical protein
MLALFEKETDFDPSNLARLDAFGHRPVAMPEYALSQSEGHALP